MTTQAPLTEPLAPGETSDPNELLAALAAALSEALSVAVDTAPLDTDELPDAAVKRPAGERGKPYWTLVWTGAAGRQQAWGHERGWQREETQTFELRGYLPFAGLAPKHAEWNAALKRMCDALWYDRRLGGRVLDVRRPEVVGNRVGRMRQGTGRYHTATLRFTVLTQDRVLRKRSAAIRLDGTAG